MYFVAILFRSSPFPLVLLPRTSSVFVLCHIACPHWPLGSEHKLLTFVTIETICCAYHTEMCGRLSSPGIVPRKFPVEYVVIRWESHGLNMCLSPSLWHQKPSNRVANPCKDCLSTLLFVLSFLWQSLADFGDEEYHKMVCIEPGIVSKFHRYSTYRMHPHNLHPAFCTIAACKSLGFLSRATDSRTHVDEV